MMPGFIFVGQALSPANPTCSVVESFFSAIFNHSTHHMWGRRFRLPTSHVLSQKASPLASRSLRGKLSICYLAFSWLNTADSTAPAVGRRKRLPHSVPWPGLRHPRSRNGQGCFRASLAVRRPSRTCSGPHPSIWRERKAFLSAPRLGDYAQSRARTAPTQDLSASDYSVVERPHCTKGKSDPGPDGRDLLAR